MAGSPAAKAGLVVGDEIIEINGKNKNLDFSNIGMAAALSKKGQKLELKVKRADGRRP
jgi:C-terminal processing protease CtpA/Prc